MKKCIFTLLHAVESRLFTSLYLWSVITQLLYNEKSMTNAGMNAVLGILIEIRGQNGNA